MAGVNSPLPPAGRGDGSPRKNKRVLIVKHLACKSAKSGFRETFSFAPLLSTRKTISAVNL